MRTLTARWMFVPRVIAGFRNPRRNVTVAHSLPAFCSARFVSSFFLCFFFMLMTVMMMVMIIIIRVIRSHSFGKALTNAQQCLTCFALLRIVYVFLFVFLGNSQSLNSFKFCFYFQFLITILFVLPGWIFFWLFSSWIWVNSFKAYELELLLFGFLRFIVTWDKSSGNRILRGS